VVNFWSMLSHGTATVSTSIPVSVSNGLTSSSKWAALSPIIQTVTFPGGADDDGALPAPLPEEQAASETPTMAAAAVAAQRILFMTDSVLSKMFLMRRE
jgi:hypothetical protein